VHVERAQVGDDVAFPLGMTMAYGEADPEGGLATIRRAHELGITFFDTAELYGNGTGSNEQLLGRGVKGFRDE
jgi:aryl-alcohol dehydrogenase-like predicted oxidoreductase